MKTRRQINIKICPHYFLNSMINIKSFYLRLVSINQISFKSTDNVIYGIEYITMKNFDGRNFLYLVFNDIDAYNECNSTGNKYLNFAFTYKNREALEIYTKIWDEIKDQIEIISDNRPTKYGKGFTKIKFEQMIIYF